MRMSMPCSGPVEEPSAGGIPDFKIQPLGAPPLDPEKIRLLPNFSLGRLALPEGRRNAEREMRSVAFHGSTVPRVERVRSAPLGRCWAFLGLTKIRDENDNQRAAALDRRC